MDPIEIVEHEAAWAHRFAELGRDLRAALGAVALRIDHVGSTAVPGLGAKPIVDIQISVAALEPTDPFRIPLEGLGYVFRADNPDRGKRYFREPPGTPRTHVHVREAGSETERSTLLFRDYLRAHGHEAARYEDLKRELAGRYRDDRRAYTDAKGAFISEAVRRADPWRREAGWTPGASDA